MPNDPGMPGYKKPGTSRTNLRTSGTYADPGNVGADGGMAESNATSSRGATIRSPGKRFGIKPAKSAAVGGGEGKAPQGVNKGGSTSGNKPPGSLTADAGV